MHAFSLSILFVAVTGICGGFLGGIWFGKRFPLRPGEWKHKIYLVTGVSLALLAAVVAATLAALS
jgi:hypothetical protein